MELCVIRKTNDYITKIEKIKAMNTNDTKNNKPNERIVNATENMLLLELFLRARESGRIKWKTKTGEWVDIRHLTNSHIAGILTYLGKKKKSRNSAIMLSLADLPIISSQEEVKADAANNGVELTNDGLPF